MSLADGIAWENEFGDSISKKDINIPVSGQGKMEETKHGAMRESNEGRGRFDLLPYEAMEALAKWYEAGSKKYDERNWENGLSVKDCINRMIRHSLKAGNGWTDEDHLAAVMWNAAAAITMMQRRPDCNDHVWQGVVKEKDQSDEVNEEEHVPVLLSKNDVTFLVTALQSGGINDIDTLFDWASRRRYITDNVFKKYIGKLSKTCKGCMYEGDIHCLSDDFTCIKDENGFLTGYIPRLLSNEEPIKNEDAISYYPKIDMRDFSIEVTLEQIKRDFLSSNDELSTRERELMGLVIYALRNNK